MKLLTTILFVLLTSTVATAHPDKTGLCGWTFFADTMETEDTIPPSQVGKAAGELDGEQHEAQKQNVNPDTAVINQLKDPREWKKGDTRYILQDRYLEKGRRFSTWLFDRMDVGMLSGYNRFAPRAEREVDAAVPLGVYVKYSLNRLSSFRLGYSYATYGVEGFGKEIVHHGVDIDFLYNLSSYLYGHNAKRLLNVSAVVGGGYVNASFRGQKNNVWKGQAGLNFDFKLTPSSHLFVEPYVSLVNDQADFSAQANAHRWDVLYGVRAGVGVNFNSRNDSLRNVNYNGNVFMEYGQGATFFPSDDIGLAESMGSGYRVSVGKWFDPYMGVRLSGVVRDFGWVSWTTEERKAGDIVVMPSYEMKTRTLMTGGRLELMLDVLNFFRGYRQHRHPVFSWQLAVGGEFGFMKKRIQNEQDDTSLKTYYAGLTASTQFLYAPEENTALFAEPQVLWADYSVPYTNAPDYKAKFTDAVYGMSVGVRLFRPVASQLRALLAPSAFVPRNFVGLILGGLRRKTMLSAKGDSKLPVSVGLMAGREFAPLATAKVQLECQQVHAASMSPYQVAGGTVFSTPALFNDDFTLLNAKLAYLLNFSSLYQGYRSDRKLNFFFELGPAYVYVLKAKESLYSKELAGGEYPEPLLSERRSKGSFSLWGGVVCDVKLSTKFHLQLESWGQYLTDTSLFQTDYSKYSTEIFTGIHVGVTYDFQ